MEKLLFSDFGVYGIITLAMSHIICVVNQKGGVGKTTTAVNLSAALAYSNCPTLLVDLDPQCNATSALGKTPLENHPLATGRPWNDSLVNSGIERLDLLPGARSLADIQALNAEDPVQIKRLRDVLAYGLSDYQYVLIDSPPSVGALTKTALIASDETLMPIQCEYFAMEGLTRMIELIRDVRNNEQRRLEFAGVVLTMVDYTLELTREVENDVRDFFGDIVFRTVIPRDVALAEASSFGQNIFEYAPRSRAARAYRELCMEVMDRG